MCGRRSRPHIPHLPLLFEKIQFFLYALILELQDEMNMNTGEEFLEIQGTAQ